MRAASYSDLARLEQRVAKLEAGRPGWSDVAEATGEGLEGEQHGETPDVCEDRYACENAKRCDGVVCSEGEVDGPQFFGMDPDMPSRIRKALGLSITHEEGLGGLVERLLAEHKRERDTAENNQRKAQSWRTVADQVGADLKAERREHSITKTRLANSADGYAAKSDENARLRSELTDAKGALLVGGRRRRERR